MKQEKINEKGTQSSIASTNEFRAHDLELSCLLYLSLIIVIPLEYSLLKAGYNHRFCHVDIRSWTSIADVTQELGLLIASPERNRRMEISPPATLVGDLDQPALFRRPSSSHQFYWWLLTLVIIAIIIVKPHRLTNC